MSIKKVGRGERVRSSLNAETWNAFIRAANANDLKTGIGGRGSGTGNEFPALTCGVKMATGAVSRRDVVGIETPAILPSDGAQAFRTRQLFEQSAPAVGKFGLATQSVPQDVYSPCITGGIVECKLFVPTNGDWIEWADIDPADSTRLKSTPSGSAQILWKDTGTNAVVDAIVRLGNPSYREYPAKVALGAIQPGSFGNAYFWQSVNGVMTDTQYLIGEGQNEDARVYLDWMHGDEAISDGKEILIGYFPSEKIWRVVGAECEAKIEPAIGQLADANGGSQTATTTPAAWNSFDASEELNTANMTLNSANATMTLPAVNATNEGIFRSSISGSLTPGSNNNTYLVDVTVNGTPTGTPLRVDGRQSGSSLSFSSSRILTVPVGPGPTLGLTIAVTSGSDSFTWNNSTWLLERNLDFA